MVRSIVGYILVGFFALIVIGTFASIGSEEMDESEKLTGTDLIAGFVIFGIPGGFLCYSGHKKQKREEVLSIALSMLKEENSINVAKISSLTNRKRIEITKDIKQGQIKGIIPYNAQLI